MKSLVKMTVACLLYNLVKRTMLTDAYVSGKSNISCDYLVFNGASTQADHSAAIGIGFIKLSGEVVNVVYEIRRNLLCLH